MCVCMVTVAGELEGSACRLAVPNFFLPDSPKGEEGDDRRLPGRRGGNSLPERTDDGGARSFCRGSLTLSYVHAFLWFVEGVG